MFEYFQIYNQIRYELCISSLISTDNCFIDTFDISTKYNRQTVKFRPKSLDLTGWLLMVYYHIAVFKLAATKSFRHTKYFTDI